MASKTALVLRATGSQGKGVRDPEEPRALALKDSGAQLFKGTLDNPDSINAAVQGCSALFLNQIPSFTDDAETREASSIVVLAKAAGVKHVVHSTTLPFQYPDFRTRYADNLAGPAIIGKGNVEDLIRESGLMWTIIRPGIFMTNFTTPISNYMHPELAEGKLLEAVDRDTILPLVDPDDIGAFATAAFQDAKRFSGKIVPLASDKLLSVEIGREIERASGKKIEVVFKPANECEEEAKTNLLVAGNRLTVGIDALVDMEEVKAWGIPLTSFREILEKNRDAVMPEQW
ncbi:NAD(P)-binding protein [Lojkania enalia]|uniref:NAD(P)-binding protein n=1 Tax=Lojkania enalia TaxID=147567 RepID=A0A9P4MYE6_9PLEO|nr:NAD(P)-binding protein [Didymosphaeria enalia]